MKKISLVLFCILLANSSFSDELPVKLFNVTIGDPIEKYLTEYVSQNTDISIVHSNNTSAEKKYFIYPDTYRKIKKKEFQNPAGESEEVKEIDENMYITEDGSPYFVFRDKCTQDNDFETVNFSNKKFNHALNKARWEKYIKEKEKEKKENQLKEEKETIKEEPKKKSKSFFPSIFDLLKPPPIIYDSNITRSFFNRDPGEFNQDTYLYDPEIRLQLLHFVTRNKHLSCYNIHANKEKIVVGIESYENFYKPDYNNFSNNSCLNLKNDFINIFATIYEVESQSFLNRFFIKKHYMQSFSWRDMEIKSDIIFVQKDVSSINYFIDENKLVLSVSCLYTESVATLSVNLFNEERHNDFMFRYKDDLSFPIRPKDESELMQEVNSINISLLNTDISGLL